MSKPSVYLAGPITGLSWEQATAWRREAIAFFRDCGIDAYSPLRGKEYLSSETKLADHYEMPLSTAKAIVMRDRFDCTKRGVVLVNLLYAQRISIGTLFEIAWANAVGVPIVLAMEPGNPHDHPFVTESCGVRVSDIHQGFELTAKILLPTVSV